MRHSTLRRTAVGTLLIAPLAAGLTACGGDGNPLAAAPYDATSQVSYAGAGSKKVDPKKPLEVTVKGDGHRITDVTATDAAGRYVRGKLSADGTRWRSTSALVAGAHYTVRVSTEDHKGRPGRRVIGFDTAAADKLLRVTFGPDSGTYGVGQPITAELSAPVTGSAARALVERNLHVGSAPQAAEGAWYWVDNRTLHYRPRVFWPTHARIDIRSTLDGVHVKDSMYGGPAKPLTLHTGDRVEAITDAGSHYMTFKRNGRTVRTIPVTTGKPGFSTRNGIKVVLGQESFVRMNSTTVGIAAGSRDAYDLPVRWATRVTWSGEYVHAAPWSVGSQGRANVSHGCTGMSMSNAKWFFDQVRRGDLVRVINSQGATMTPFDNGFGDWNLTWDAWQRGSATGAQQPVQAPSSAPQAASPARLQPGA
ncbi:Ig-like domain-containing protein [Streptomyces sp. NPDC059373]